VPLQFKLPCERCGEWFYGDSKRSAVNALNAHRQWCKGHPTGRENGHEGAVEEEAAFSNGE
jgi:hypothetical protein